MDLIALGEKIRLAKAAKIDAMVFLSECYEKGLTIPESLAALDAAIAKASPAPDPAAAPAKS